MKPPFNPYEQAKELIAASRVTNDLERRKAMLLEAIALALLDISAEIAAQGPR